MYNGFTLPFNVNNAPLKINLKNLQMKKLLKNRGWRAPICYLILAPPRSTRGFPGGASGKEAACQCRRHETWVPSLGGEDPLEEGTATHSNILAWRIPQTQEPGGLQYAKSQTWLKRLSTHAQIIQNDLFISRSFTELHLQGPFSHIR